MEQTRYIILDIKKNIEKSKNLIKMLNGLTEHVFEFKHNINCDFRRLEECIRLNEEFYKLAPFKIGDIIELIDPPLIDNNNSWGWLGAKHLFVKGSLCKVKNIGYNFNKSSFTLGIEFLNDSWISHDGKINPIEEKFRSTYCGLSIKRFKEVTEEIRISAPKKQRPITATEMYAKLFYPNDKNTKYTQNNTSSIPSIKESHKRSALLLKRIR